MREAHVAPGDLAIGSATVYSPAAASHSTVPRDAGRHEHPRLDRDGLGHAAEHGTGADAVARRARAA